MGKEQQITYPCYYAICAGMPCGPLLIPELHRLSEKAAIEYVLELMEKHVVGRAVIRWDEKGNKKVTLFWRDKNGKPYAAL